MQSDHTKATPSACVPTRGARVTSRMIPLMVLALLPASVFADTFEDRVERANAVFETEDGATYEKKLGPYIQQAIKKCAPAGSTSKENWGKFVLVVDVSSEGRIVNPDVKPETQISACFSKEFISQTLPAPPHSIVTDGLAPLVVEIYVVP